MSTPDSPPADPAVRLAQTFPLLAHVYLRWAESLADRDGISVPRLRLLGVLHCEGPQIMSALGDQLGVTARNVTALVDALEAEGLVRRTPHPTDRRATVIDLTPSGAAASAKQLHEFSGKMAELFRGLTGRDQREFIRLADRLLGLLRPGGSDRPEAGRRE